MDRRAPDSRKSSASARTAGSACSRSVAAAGPRKRLRRRTPVLKRRLGCNRRRCGGGYLCSGWRRVGWLIEMRIEIRPTSAESMSAAEASVVAGAQDIGGALGRGRLYWKFHSALGTGFSGLIIARLTLTAPFEVQRPATIVAELRTHRVGMVAEGASAGEGSRTTPEWQKSPRANRFRKVSLLSLKRGWRRFSVL